MTHTPARWTYDITAQPAANLPFWQECLCAVEVALLHIAPVYYGYGVPRGDGSAVILIPGFLLTDTYLHPMTAWLRRLGYAASVSGIGRNNECPDLIIRHRLNDAIDRALAETGGRKVHLIGHSLGGLLALAAAAQRPHDVASVTTLGSPFAGNAAHPGVLLAARLVAGRIRVRSGNSLPDACYTCHCPCDFATSVRGALPESVGMTAIYSRSDSLVDWRYCLTGNPELDFEAPGTHLGMVLNPSVYSIVANRLARHAT